LDLGDDELEAHQSEFEMSKGRAVRADAHPTAAVTPSNDATINIRPEKDCR
jgi:hypothetical protein